MPFISPPLSCFIGYNLHVVLQEYKLSELKGCQLEPHTHMGKKRKPMS